MTTTLLDPTSLVLELAGLIAQPPISIEILPGGIEEWASTAFCLENEGCHIRLPFVYSEGHLGIPKKVLYSLYSVAISMLRNNSPAYNVPSSSVVLLANPAHQTCLNLRKRLILRGQLSPAQELEFIALLVQGSKECAKQSTIWSHRMWIFIFLYNKTSNPSTWRLIPPPLEGWGNTNELKSYREIPPNILREEYDLIRNACTSYPRNYHAWSHWHSMTDAARLLAFTGDSSGPYIEVILEEGDNLMRWVDSHVSDYSAMHQLCNLVRLLNFLASLGQVSTTALASFTPISLAKHAVGLVASYPSHESLWTYLRATLGMLNVEEAKNIVREVRLLPESSFSLQLHEWSAHTGIGRIE